MTYSTLLPVSEMLFCYQLLTHLLLHMRLMLTVAIYQLPIHTNMQYDEYMT